MLEYLYYEVVAIEGKGLGCVATKDIKKNTLILQEIPQIFLKHDIKEEFESWVTKLMYQFNRMSKNDQKEFLKLPTKPKDEKKEELNIEEIANTGKSFSEAPILASTNPQYDKRLFIDLPVLTRKLQAQNMYTT